MSLEKQEGRDKNETQAGVNINPQFGLSEEEVKERIAGHEDNCAVESSTRSVGDIIKTNVFTYFNLVFAVLAILLIMVGSWKDMFFLVVILANTGIGIFQEIHSKKVLDALTLTQASTYTVIREGREVSVASEELVKDDIVILTAGCQIPADAIVVEGTAKVNEALLTGEADEIEKNEQDELLSGSFIISGNVRARLEKVGKDAYISRLKLQATKTEEGERSEMIRSLNYLIIAMGIIIIPIGITLFVQSFVYNGGTLHDSVTGMVAAVIGMIPEGLYLLTSVAMAVSVIRLAKKNVLVHDMKCIETLARVDVLCVDKTGTITEEGMLVKDFIAENGMDEVEVRSVFIRFVRAQENDNATIAAIKNYCEHLPDSSNVSGEVQRVISFSSESKYSGAVIDGRSYVLGAPEFILGENGKAPDSVVEAYIKEGYRVLAFGEYGGNLDGTKLTRGAKLLGVVLITNPIREGAKDIFAYFAKNEVEVKVISGDNPLTVSAVAREANIPGAEKYVDATTIKDKKEFVKAVEAYTVFGRVTPEQKELLIQAIREHKKTVAMVGDGVNDVLALKSADCSVAMAGGSDAASNVSQLVLMDSDFRKMPAVVDEGRRVVNNIQRTASLYIVKNIFSILLAIFSMILMLDYPLEPSQITLISLFTIGIPSFILALEPNKQKIKGHFLTNVFMKALPAGLTDFLAVSGLVFFSTEFAVEPHCLSTACTVLIAMVGFMVLYQVCKPVSAGHVLLIVSLVLGLLFCMFFLGEFFSIGSITRKCAMLMLVFAILTEPIFRYINLIVDFGRVKLQQIGKIEG